MRRFGLIAIVAVAAVVAVVAVASRLSDEPAEDGLTVAQDSEREITVTLEGEDAAGRPLSTDTLREEPAAVLGEGYASSIGLPGGDGTAPPLPQVADRKIVRNAAISLGVEDVAGAVQRVESIAAGAGGFVSESSVFVEPSPEGDPIRPRESQSATVSIRVPSSAYVSVMAQLRDLGAEVRSETSSTSDVSEEFADLEARLRNLQATEARYLELLKKAETIPDILTLQDRINSVRLEIERIQGRMNLLNDLTDLATIVVQLRPLAVVEEEPSEPGWAQEVWDGAWDASKDAMRVMGTAAIVIGVVLAWLAVPALAIGIGWRLFGPRRERGGEAGGSGTAA